MLDLLGEVIVFKENVENKSPDSLQIILDGQKKGIEFLEKAIYTETNSDIFDAAFKSYITSASARKLFTSIDEIFTLEKKSGITRPYLTNAILQKVFKEKELQNDLLPQILADSWFDVFSLSVYSCSTRRFELR